MTIEAALIKEQGVTLAVVVVKKHVVDHPGEAQRTVVGFQGAFPGVPIILMGQDPGGRATYYGRRDLVKFLAGVPFRALPWKRWSWG